jgi:hypothetical protein
MTTEKLIESCINERQARQHQRALNRAINGENIYTMFVTWCFAFKGEKAVKSPKVFSEFLKEQNIVLTFWQRKYIAEHYFGFQFIWDRDKEDWWVQKKEN